MDLEKKCIKCGSQDVVPGGMNTLGGVSFVPDDSRQTPLQVGRINLSADMCLECGFVELNGKVNKAGVKRKR